jgi:hypothetical protein
MQFQGDQELAWVQDGVTLVAYQVQEIAVAADQLACATLYCGCQELLILGVSADPCDAHFAWHTQCETLDPAHKLLQVYSRQFLDCWSRQHRSQILPGIRGTDRGETIHPPVCDYPAYHLTTRQDITDQRAGIDDDPQHRSASDFLARLVNDCQHHHQYPHALTPHRHWLPDRINQQGSLDSESIDIQAPPHKEYQVPGCLITNYLVG